MRLDSWIDPRHLDPDAVAAARGRFDSDCFASVVVDGFLLPERIAGLRACFDGDGAFAPHYGLINQPTDLSHGFRERAVDADTFAAAPDRDRLAQEGLLRGPAPGRILSIGWSTHLRWLMLLRSRPLRDWLAALTGINGIDTLETMPRTMRRGNFCRVHDDTAGTRRLCMLLYVDDGWRPGFGGRFQHVVDGEVARNVEPLGNRLLIHRPRIDLLHQVEGFAPEAADWTRQTYSIWFSSSRSPTLPNRSNTA